MRVIDLVRLYAHHLVGMDLSYHSPMFGADFTVRVVALTDNGSIRVTGRGWATGEYSLAPMQLVELLTAPEIGRRVKHLHIQLAWARARSRENSRN